MFARQWVCARWANRGKRRLQMVNFKNAHHYQNRLVLVASSGRGKQARHDDVICLLLSVFKMPTWHKMVLLISADSSGFPQPTPIST